MVIDLRVPAAVSGMPTLRGKGVIGEVGDPGYTRVRPSAAKKNHLPVARSRPMKCAKRDFPDRRLIRSTANDGAAAAAGRAARTGAAIANAAPPSRVRRVSMSASIEYDGVE